MTHCSGNGRTPKTLLRLPFSDTQAIVAPRSDRPSCCRAPAINAVALHFAVAAAADIALIVGVKDKPTHPAPADPGSLRNHGAARVCPQPRHGPQPRRAPHRHRLRSRRQAGRHRLASTCRRHHPGRARRLHPQRQDRTAAPFQRNHPLHREHACHRGPRRRGNPLALGHRECAADAHGKEFTMKLLTVWTSCARDEGRPLGIGLQGRVPKPLQAAAVKSRGRERWSKSSRITLSRCVLVRRTQVNPSKTRRYPENRRQNQGRFDLLGPACREPDDWAGGDRRRGGVTPTQAFARKLQEPVAPMAREKLKRGLPQGESTEAEHWGGPTRTSDEGSVMGPEQRGRGQVAALSRQLATGGPGEGSRQAVQHRQEAGLRSLQGGQGQCWRRWSVGLGLTRFDGRFVGLRATSRS